MRLKLLYWIIPLVVLLSPSLVAQDRYSFLSSLSVGYTYAGGNLSAPVSAPNSIGATTTNNSFFPSGTGFNGFNGSLSARVHRFFGFAVDFGGMYASSSNPDFGFCSITPLSAFVCNPIEESLHTSGALYTLLAGPRCDVQLGRFTPFAEVLVGVARAMDRANTVVSTPTPFVSRHETSFAGAFGGGVAFRLSRRIDWRLEADWLQTRFALEKEFPQGPMTTSQHMLGNSWRISTGPSFRIHF